MCVYWGLGFFCIYSIILAYNEQITVPLIKALNIPRSMKKNENKIILQQVNKLSTTDIAQTITQKYPFIYLLL